jgi:hypothetical protein
MGFQNNEARRHSVANNSSGIKKKKKKGGWIEVEEIPNPSTEVSPAIVAGASASDVPKPSLSISLNDVVNALDEVLGGYKWRIFNEGAIDLTPEERLKLLEAVLGSAPNVENVRALFEAVHVKDSGGWTIAGSCPAIVRVAQDFLSKNGISVEPPQLDTETQRLLDVLNNRSGASS